MRAQTKQPIKGGKAKMPKQGGKGGGGGGR